MFLVSATEEFSYRDAVTGGFFLKKPLKKPFKNAYRKRVKKNPDDESRANGGLDAYLSEIAKFKVLTSEEEIAYAKAAVLGCMASVWKLICHNLKLVIAVAVKYQNRGLDYLEIIQEGSNGLLRAVEKFDHTKGFRFSTYAIWWIKQSITRALANKSRMIRIPDHVHHWLSKINKARSALTTKLGRDPSCEEISIEIDCPLKKTKSLSHVGQKTLSLSQPLTTTSEANLSDIVEDPSFRLPEDKIWDDQLREVLFETMECLTDREQTVIKNRFGLLGKKLTLLELSNMIGVSRERVRQIVGEAMKKLRHPCRMRPLADFYKYE